MGWGIYKHKKLMGNKHDTHGKLYGGFLKNGGIPSYHHSFKIGFSMMA
jgi:hypothetical protein